MTVALQRYHDFAYCPRCGHAFQSGDFHAADCLYLCSVCTFDFYQNPLPSAVTVIPDPKHPNLVLVLKRSTKPGLGLWCIPGGFIKYGESPTEAAVREAYEETGSEVDIGSVLCASLIDYSYRGRNICIVEIAYLARLRGAAAAVRGVSSEASEMFFVPVEELLAAPERLAFPEQAEVLSSYQSRLANRGVVFP
jgi:8-oxo-dGTP diphosphatase